MNHKTHWRMWLLGTLATDLHVDLTTLYGVFDDEASDLGRQLRHTVANLALWAEADTDGPTMLDIAHQAADSIVKRYQPAHNTPCEACE